MMLFGNAAGDFRIEDVQLGWHIQAWFELRDGVLCITELRVRSANGSTLRSAHGASGPAENYPHELGRPVPVGGITKDLLRRFSLPALRAPIGEDKNARSTLALYGFNPDQDFTRRPGRKGRDDGFYAAWAAAYLDKCAQTRRPHLALAEETNYGKDTIRDFVQKARNRGLLTKAPPGRAGGQLLPKAVRLLEQMKGDSQ